MVELHEDPAFPARSLLLIGGVEMAVVKMIRHDDPEIQAMGYKLQSRVAWFFIDESVDVPDSEQDTQIIKPSAPPSNPSNRGG